MRILHATDCYLPRLGGIEMHVHDLVREQRAAGHDVRVVTATAFDPAGGPDPAWVHRMTPRGAGSSLPRIAGGADLARLVDTFAPDVVHAHVSVVSPFATGLARRVSAAAVPTLVTVHSLWPPLPVLSSVARSLLALRSWPVLWSAVSHRAAEPLRAVLGPGAPLVVLPNAVDPAWWRVTPAPTGVPTIVSVMRLAARKRPLALARMLRQVRASVPGAVPLRAVIVGDGPRRGGLERHLARHGLDWVEVRGRLDRAAIRGVYAEATVYVAPALLESFGIAALEARSAGLPVVASTRGGVGEFVTDGVHGILAGDDAAMVAALARLVTDEGLRSGMAAHNRAVAPGLDWAAACSASLDAYALAARIAAGNGGSGAGRRTVPAVAAAAARAGTGERR
jgi:glycosyltransferase involved in cell wall biosynthesis